MQQIRIAIADDQALIREGLKTVLDLEPGLRVVATAANGEEACRAARAHQPDVLLLDIRMPQMDGLACIGHVRRDSPATRIVMLTTFCEDAYIVEALAGGAVGFLLKDIEVPKLVEAIHDAAEGKTVLPQEVTATLAGYLAKRPEPAACHAGGLPRLTGREREVADLIAQGFTNRQIASALYLTDGTVRNTVSAIYAKIGIGDRVQAALYLKDRLPRGS